MTRRRRSAIEARTADGGTASGSGDDRFNLAFECLGELLALARKDFDAVVFERIVRRRVDPRVEGLAGVT